MIENNKASDISAFAILPKETLKAGDIVVADPRIK